MVTDRNEIRVATSDATPVRMITTLVSLLPVPPSAVVSMISPDGMPSRHQWRGEVMC